MNVIKKVDEVYPFGINTSIGPTGTIKRLFRNRDFFADRGYEMSLFALQKKRVSRFRSSMELLEITSLLEDNSNAMITTNKGKPGWRSKLQSRKHAFVENNYITASLAYHRAHRLNKVYIKNYIAENRDSDIVVFHDTRSCYNFCKNRKNKRAKVVLFIHGDGNDTAMFRKRHPKLYGTREERELIKDLHYTYDQCDCIVWISKLAYDTFCHNHLEFAKKALAVVNGINDLPTIAKTPSTHHKYRLVCSGTVCERKGQYLIIEAMRRMDSNVLAETHLTIIGTGPDFSRLSVISEEYGLQEHVTFTGNVHNSKVPDHLAAENIYILMSNNEGLPISILEAMRAGLPIISTRIAGIPEEVDERNGVLIEPDVEQLTAVLNHLPDYDWKTLGANSRRRFEQEFTFTRMMNDYCNMFDGLQSKENE